MGGGIGSEWTFAFVVLRGLFFFILFFVCVYIEI